MREAQPPRLATVWIDQLMQPAADGMESAGRDESYVGTGIADLDSLTRGVRCGELWVVSGRSGVGKTVLATNMLRACAVQQRRRALLISRKEPPQHVAQRLLCAESRVPLHSAATGRMTGDDWARLARRMGQISHVLLELAQLHDLDLEALEGHLSSVRANDVPPVRLVVIDDVAAGPRQLPTLVALQELARDQQVAVMAVVEEDVERSTMQQRSVEQLADIAIRIHRDDQEDKASARAGEMDLSVTRNRRGPTMDIVVAFQGHYGRIVDMPN